MASCTLQECVCLSVKLGPRPGPGGGHGHVLGCPGTGSQRGGVSSAPPPDSRPLIGRGCYDVVGIADRNPSARRRAGGIVRHPGLCYVFAYSPGHGRVLAAAARSGVPAAAAAAAAMVSPVTVVSARASEPVSGAHRPGDWAAAGQAAGGRGRGRDLAAVGVPGREVGAVKAPPPTAPRTRGAPPPRSPCPPAGGRKTVGM